MKKNIGLLSLIVLIPTVSFAVLSLTELQQFDYGDLTLTGVKIDKTGNIACFKLTTGSIKTAKKFDYIGRNYGRIIEINPYGLKIAETFELNQGEIFERQFNWPIVSDSTLRRPCQKI